MILLGPGFVGAFQDVPGMLAGQCERCFTCARASARANVGVPAGPRHCGVRLPSPESGFRFSLFCAYAKSGFTQNAEESIREICDAHSRVLAN